MRFGKNKKENLRRTITKTDDKNNNSNIGDYSPEDKETIVPIIFTSFGHCRNNGLTNLPLNFSASANKYIIENAETMLDPIVKKKSLYQLDRNNENIIINNLKTYIVQNSIMNICSVLNSSEYGHYFNIIPVLPYIQNELQESAFDIAILLQQISSEIGTEYMDTGMQEEMVNHTIAFMKNISMQISQIVCLAICKGADKAITEVGMNIHIAPGINDLYKAIINDFPAIREIKENYPQDLATHCTILLKQLFSDIVERIMFNTINKDIQYVLINILSTFYYQYNDYLYYEFDAAREQMLHDIIRNRK